MRGRGNRPMRDGVLAPEEQELLSAFGQLPSGARRALIDFLRALG